MQYAATMMRTTIGQKVIVAVTGVILFGFVIGHLVGNLLIFVGRDTINAYGATLHENPGLLWVARVVLLVAVTVHIGLSVQLGVRNAKAREAGYKAGKKDLITNYAAKTMIISGPLLLAYLIFHLAHLTFGADLAPHGFSATDVYANVIYGFRIKWIAGTYIVASLLLGLHLFHGASSVFQTLGASHPKIDGLRHFGAGAVALLIAGGNCFIPVAVMFRLVGQDL